MQATEFEFRHRWWLFGAIFALAFLTTFLDRVPLAERLSERLAASGAITQTQALHAVLGSATLILLAAALLRTWGSSYLRREVVHDRALHGEVLHADGPYRHVRNPLYLGNVMMAVAVSSLAPAAGSVLMICGMLLFCYRLIQREEAALAAQQGLRYAAYVRAVPRLWPALRARIAPSGSRPDWRSGLAAESFFWTYVAGLGLVSLTLNALWFIGALMISPLSSALAGILMRGHDTARG